MKNIALFASGTGTNVLNLISRAAEYKNIKIACIIVDTKTSPLPQIIEEKHPQIPVYQVLINEELEKSQRKAEHEARMIELLARHEVKWGLLAGYMRIVGPRLLNFFGMQRLINIHPSLLPKYPGLEAYERAFKDGVTESGITIHLVDSGMDTGPILLQRNFERKKEDTLSDFIQRGKEVEWQLYPEILKQLDQGA